MFHFDGGGEFTSSQLEYFLSIHGIHHAKSCLDTPRENENADRKHKHITETALNILTGASPPYFL